MIVAHSPYEEQMPLDRVADCLWIVLEEVLMPDPASVPSSAVKETVAAVYQPLVYVMLPVAGLVVSKVTVNEALAVEPALLVQTILSVEEYVSSVNQAYSREYGEEVSSVPGDTVAGKATFSMPDWSSAEVTATVNEPVEVEL